jgi:hypothetical protein
MNWTETVTAIVAVYGAALGTYNLLVRRQENKPKVKVKISMGFLTYATGQTSEAMIFLEAANAGRTTVTLSSPFFRLPDKQQVVFPNPQTNATFPHELLPGKSCRIWIGAREFASTLKSNGYSGKVKITGVYRDQVDSCYNSKQSQFDIDNWARSSNVS